MRKTCVVIVILLLALGGYTCGRSNDESGVESKVTEEVKSLEKKASGEVKKLEEDYKVLEAEKDYRKALEEEPKAPPEAIEEAEGGVSLEEGLASPPE
ncbi:MAG: hypothetical protein AMS17_10785 [Spirochaetes bacterium DG_61]|nr:MAG: hypothetical protein AMS17_10785 [Spirochaetes bacterium DG_61]